MADEIEEIVETIEPNEPVSHRDDINNDVAAAMASLKGEPEAVEQVNETEQKSEIARAPDGKFAAKEAAPVEAAAEQKLPPTEDVTKASEQPSTAAIAPPVSWAADVKAVWPTLPPAVQQAVIKREQEASNGFKQYSETVRRYESTLAPIAQAAQARGMSVDDAIKRLNDGNTFLEQQPAEAILWLAQKNGIDLAELASNPPAVQQPARPDPQFAQVTQTVSHLQQYIERQEFNTNLSAAEKFAAEKPYYADVEGSLPDLIKEVKAADPSLSGVALLEKAYDRAVWLNPDVRAKVIAAEREAAEKARTAKVVEKSTQANRAAVSVKGSSAAAMPPRRAAESAGTPHDDVRAAIAQLRAG